ncbi:HD-GYP domain-containing protein [Parvibaculum sp. MBR-TMA-1.3b-4.2]|jgi:HD-GYP domain-containing protein (c-di-GMP phosphodiesterase class II)
MARNIALLHHERYDGKGYPARLSGKNTPLEARIVAVVDVYDALRSVRSYKAQRSHEDTISQLMKECRGDPGGFDPLVTEAFLDTQANICAVWDRSMLSSLASIMKDR